MSEKFTLDFPCIDVLPAYRGEPERIHRLVVACRGRIFGCSGVNVVPEIMLYVKVHVEGRQQQELPEKPLPGLLAMPEFVTHIDSIGSQDNAQGKDKPD